jgi:uncharacterized protein
MNLAPTDPSAIRLTDAIRSGALDELARMLEEQPELARARIAGRRGGWRTPLHVAADWPGYFPNGPAVVRLLIEAGADPSAPSDDGPSETPLHWAASSDDIDALDALLDSGADIEADGAVIAGGTPIADAVAFGQWKAARRLLERGARANLWQAAALGLTGRVREELSRTHVSQRDLDNALWCAAHGGQRDTAALLVDRGAAPDWVGHDGLTAAQAAERSHAHELADWLEARASEP